LQEFGWLELDSNKMTTAMQSKVPFLGMAGSQRLPEQIKEAEQSVSEPESVMQPSAAG